ncbi:hypothetical protein JW935_07665 [candidate division KSB1 bacterium]|nr:hypothetical protein [candidate division KSB1 bacterium]
MKIYFYILLAGVVLFFCCNTSVNRTIRIADGSKKSGGCHTVNGSVNIGRDCIVRGACRTVNGGIHVDEGSMVGTLQSVNGSIRLQKDVEVKGDVESVNGEVDCGKNVVINGEIETVNGRIKISKTTVKGIISTFNGNIELADHSAIHRNIIIRDNHGRSNRTRPLEIVIKENSVVNGDIIVKDRDIEVIIILQDGGKVYGEVKGAVVREV